MRRMAPEDRRSKAGFDLTHPLIMNDPQGADMTSFQLDSLGASRFGAVERSGRRLQLRVGFVCFLQNFLRFIAGQALFSCELEGLEP